MKIPIVGDLRQKLKDKRAAGQRATARAALQKRYGFATIALRDEPPECVAGSTDMARWAAAGTLEPFETLYAESERADLMLANAQKMHVFLWQRLFDDFDHVDGPGADRLTEPFRRWFESKRSPIAAAAYAKALYHAAFDYRGGSFAADVREEQWAEYNKRLELGRDALAATEAAGRESQPWLWSSYDYGRQDVSSLDEFNRRFHEAWSRDMSNTSLCVSHGIRLLPRWYGHDERDLESFARNVTGMTQDRFGDGLYALIYGYGYHIGAHEIGDTACDRDRLKRGFEDLAARFPAQSILNRYAAGMYFSRDYRACADAFRRMTAIVPDLWLGSTREKQVTDALETLRVVV